MADAVVTIAATISLNAHASIHQPAAKSTSTPAPNNNWTRRKERSACKPKNAKDEQFIPMRFLPFVERACASLRWPVALVQRGSEKRCR